MMATKLKDSGHARSTTRLGTGLDKSLSAYATAAAAAGVSLLALVVPAEAKIVYTPAHVHIPVNGGWIPIDLNHDGIADFSFSNVNYGISDGFFDFLIAGANGPSNAIWGIGGNGRGQRRHAPPKGGYNGVFASALRLGFTVRANKSYFQKGTSHWLMGLAAGGRYDSTTAGQWNYTQHRYLGLKFVISGQVHFGWARVNYETSTVTGYAYETIPNKPIITGKTKGPDVITLEPASLGRLAQGASGISVWREKK